MDRDTALLLTGALIAFISSLATAFLMHTLSLRATGLKRKEEEAVRRSLGTNLGVSATGLGERAMASFPAVYQLWVKLAQLEEMARAGYQANPVYATVQDDLMKELEEAENTLQAAPARGDTQEQTPHQSID